MSWWKSLCLCILVLCSLGLNADPVLLTPKTNVSPSKEIYAQIIRGAKNSDPSIVSIRYKNDTQQNTNALAPYLERPETPRFITVGQSSTDFVLERAKRPIRCDAAALTATLISDEILEQCRVISILPSPDLVMSSIRSLNMNIKRVHTVISSDRLAYIAQAQAAASHHNLELVVHVADSLVSTSQTISMIVKTLRENTDAIWIAQSDFLRESQSDDFLIEASWKNNFMLASSIPSHARRGVAIGFIPDFYLFGRFISNEQLANTQHSEVDQKLIFSTADITNSVLNLRTSYHLGLTPTKTTRDSFNIILGR